MRGCSCTARQPVEPVSVEESVVDADVVLLSLVSAAVLLDEPSLDDDEPTVVLDESRSVVEATVVVVPSSEVEPARASVVVEPSLSLEVDGGGGGDVPTASCSSSLQPMPSCNASTRPPSDAGVDRRRPIT